MYGEDSVKLGKTHKIIGTLYIITEKAEEARQYLMQAYRIFESKGQDKLMKEVSSKLKLINAGKKPEEKIGEEEKGLISEEKSKSSPSGSPPKDAAPVAKTKGKKKGKKKAK